MCFLRIKNWGRRGENIFLGKVVDRFVLGDYWWFWIQWVLEGIGG